MKINPLHDLVLIKPIEQTASPGGIVIPENATPGMRTGRVIAVGPGTHRSFSLEVFCRVSVSVGDVVKYGASSASRIEHEGERLDLLHDHDILLTITEL